MHSTLSTPTNPRGYTTDHQIEGQYYPEMVFNYSTYYCGCMKLLLYVHRLNTKHWFLTVSPLQFSAICNCYSPACFPRLRANHLQQTEAISSITASNMSKTATASTSHQKQAHSTKRYCVWWPCMSDRYIKRWDKRQSLLTYTDTVGFLQRLQVREWVKSHSRLILI